MGFLGGFFHKIGNINKKSKIQRPNANHPEKLFNQFFVLRSKDQEKDYVPRTMTILCKIIKISLKVASHTFQLLECTVL